MSTASPASDVWNVDLWRGWLEEQGTTVARLGPYAQAAGAIAGTDRPGHHRNGDRYRPHFHARLGFCADPFGAGVPAACAGLLSTRTETW